MIVGFLLIACARIDPNDAPDAWTRAALTCPRDPYVTFNRSDLGAVRIGTIAPSSECVDVLVDDFGIDADHVSSVSAAWSLVLWGVEPDAYDRAAYVIDAVIVVDDLDGAEARYDDGVVSVVPWFGGGHVGASVLVHESAHAWSREHVRCPHVDLDACDRDASGSIGTQIAWLDALLVEVTTAGFDASAAESVAAYRDELAHRIVP